MTRRLRAFLRGDEGQDLLEYSLLVSLIAFVCIASVSSAGTAVANVFTELSTAVAALPVGP